jgi:D-tyrosyl-tRNA(Tyr) deacylase
MKAVIQRVTKASVEIENKIRGVIGQGLLILLGIEEADNDEDIDWLSGKISRLRIFADEKGVMNLPVTEVGGGVLLISQFTLHASIKKGNRPSYVKAARPEIAIPLYGKFRVQLEKNINKKVETGEFGANMKVSLINDGPVTIVIDTKNRE